LTGGTVVYVDAAAAAADTDMVAGLGGAVATARSAVLVRITGQTGLSAAPLAGRAGRITSPATAVGCPAAFTVTIGPAAAGANIVLACLAGIAVGHGITTAATGNAGPIRALSRAINAVVTAVLIFGTFEADSPVTVLAGRTARLARIGNALAISADQGSRAINVVGTVIFRTTATASDQSYYRNDQ